MGRQARLRAIRRAQNFTPTLDPAGMGSLIHEPPSSAALDILRELVHDIRCYTLANPRRCWELLVEMLAHHSGWNTDTADDHELWDIVPFASERMKRFAEVWNREVDIAVADGLPFSEPIGDLLAEADSNYRPMPMELVRNENAEALRSAAKNPETVEGVLLKSPGTGRFALDTLVYNSHLQLYIVEEDPWLYRAALVNVRFLANYSTRHHEKENPVAEFALAQHTEGNEVLEKLEHAGITVRTPGSNAVRIIGGRVWAVNAHPEIIDLDFAPNWLFGMQFWTLTPPWQYSLLIDQKKFPYYGTWAEFLAHHSDAEIVELMRNLESSKRARIRYDFAMTNPG